MHNSSAIHEYLLEAGDLRVRFYWQGDRYAHEISVRLNGQWQPALTSVEGSPEDEWPASAPFQSLHIEQREDGRTLAFLVGMAGKSHWSASVEIDRETNSVLFDIACRVRDCTPGFLGSNYHPAECSRLKIEPTHRFGPTAFEQSPTNLRISAEPASSAGPQTVRWDYRVCLGG